MSTKYFCTDCKAVADEREIIRGVTISEDEYINDTCPDCGSDDITEIDEADVCPVCGGYHYGTKFRIYSDAYRECAEAVYTKRYGQMYVLDAYGNVPRMVNALIRLGMSLEEYCMDEARDFVEFVCEHEKSEKSYNSIIKYTELTP